MNNRQLRIWVFMLYPDNSKHQAAINYLDLLDNSLYIEHKEKYINDELINKAHYHCILKFDKPYWLSTLLNDLNLSEEDAHLFHSYKDFKDKNNHQKFKSLEDYGNYLDHIENDNKIDKYSIDDFHGGLKPWIAEIINNRENETYQSFLELYIFVKKYNADNLNDTRFFTFGDWYKLCCDKGYGKLFFQNWYKMRDILKPYITMY